MFVFSDIPVLIVGIAPILFYFCLFTESEEDIGLEVSSLRQATPLVRLYPSLHLIHVILFA